MKCEETTLHTFDKKAFGKSRHITFVIGIVALVGQFVFTFILNSDDIIKNGNTIVFAMQLLAIGLNIYAYWVKRFIGKRSTIVSSPECVVYRKRRGGITALIDRLAAGFGGHARVMYTVYVITQADAVDYTEKGPIRVRGDISAVRVYADGTTEHDKRTCRRVVIPQYYTYAHLIRYALTKMAGMKAEFPDMEQEEQERLEY